MPEQHLVHENSEQVPVDTLTVASPLQHLWSQVGDGPAESSIREIVDSFLGEPEVGEHRMSFMVDDDVLWLQVAEDYISTMEVLQGQYDLSAEDLDYVLVEAALPLDHFAEVTTK